MIETETEMWLIATLLFSCVLCTAIYSIAYTAVTLDYVEDVAILFCSSTLFIETDRVRDDGGLMILVTLGKGMKTLIDSPASLR